MAREKLRIEVQSEELIAEITRVLRKIRYPCHASRHLERSSNSVFFNLGEGIVAFQPKIKASKYGIARSEANEVQKAARVLVLQGRLAETDIARINTLADYIIGSLTNLIKNLEQKM